jgi:hypothetical protein
MTWDAHRHTRDSVLHAVTDLVNQRRDGRLPWAEVPGTAEFFDTPADLLGTLQMRWHARLSGAIERELTEQPWDLEAAVVHAWRNLQATHPGVRAVLDAHVGEPAMRKARAKELALLATASGRTGMGDPQAQRVGADIERRARAVVVTAAPSAESAGRAGWLTRLRHALAA